MPKLVIGISGQANAGKNLFAQLLSKKIDNVRQFALADHLKYELQESCLKLYGIDPLSCSRKEKNDIRDFMVFHGDYRRKQTNGRYWIDKLNTQIVSTGEKDIVCVTDIRYSVNDKDELHWLKNELNGILIHIKRFTYNPETKVKRFLSAPNLHEADNDPKLQAAADYKIEWPETSVENLDVFIDDFVNYLKFKRNLL